MQSSLDDDGAGHSPAPRRRLVQPAESSATPPHTPHQSQHQPVRLRLDIAYDGAGFSGWAIQPDRRTIQGEIEAALARVLHLDPPPRLTVAGRTDAGVHARAQVAHVDLREPSLAPNAAPSETASTDPSATSRVDTSTNARLMRRLNAVLPPDVRVHGITRAAAGFDARFSALSRRYCYRIADRPSTHDPLTRGQVLWHRRELDIDLMADAAAHLLGEHDFAALCRPREGASTVRRVMDGIVQRTPAGVIEIWIEADAFCHSMIRFIAGALVAVGECRREPEWMADLLARRTRDPAAMVLPAHGLTLEAIRYPADADLAATAMAHRVLRGPAHLG